MTAASPSPTCHERALRLLSVRPRTRRELETRLLRAGFEQQEVALELDRLEEVGLVDDARFASEFAEHALNRRLEGRRAVADRLASKGVDRRLVERALDEVAGEEHERLSRLAEVRAQRLASLPTEAAYRRLLSFLVRRGHDPAASRHAAAAALGLDRAERAP